MLIKGITYILALIFFLSGSAKLAGMDFEIAAFARWGYPLSFMYFIGAAEVAGGIALIINRLAKFAAPALAVLMIGAAGTHIIHQEYVMLIIASGILGLTVYLNRQLWLKQDARK